MLFRSKRAAATSSIVLVVAGLGGCAAAPPIHKGGDASFSPVLPVEAGSPAGNQGSIYDAASAQSLFADFKARRIGDVLTVVLSEQTNARKSADMSSSRTSSAKVTDPTVFGGPVTKKGVPIFNTDVAADQSFKGEGDAAQSNLLEGQITVTVAEVLANGNLVVRGEKWIHINHGDEYLRLRGIVRPVDISASNTVLSTQVADAELAYGGTGQVARSSAPGWLTRFFTSRLWPF
jgi:flagellar L-ring protein FlgH